MAVKIINVLGITGVDADENRRALVWAHKLEWPILLVALWIPVQWYLEETGTVSMDVSRIFDWAIWLVFCFETCLLTSLVRNKRRYLINNWMNLVIIFGGLPLEWTYTPLVGVLRNLRLLLMIYLLIRVFRRLRRFLAQGRVGPTLVIALIVVVTSGIIVTRLDPSMGSVWDGMWWAWVTVSHTGYGDIVPKNGAGRFFGALLILLGVVLVSLLTANLSAFIIGGEVEKVEKEERKEEVLLQQVSERLERIEKLLAEQQANSRPPQQ